MTTTTITNFRANIYSIVENTIRHNDPVQITTKDGNVVMISEDEYRSLLETLSLTSVPGIEEKLIDGMTTPLADTLSEEEVVW